MSAPAIQVGALSGVPRSMAGLAGGLVETLREIGGGLGVAVGATVLVSRFGGVGGAAHPAVHRLALVNAFHAAFWVMFIAAALGAFTAALAFPRTKAREVKVEEGLTPDSIVLEPEAVA